MPQAQKNDPKVVTRQQQGTFENAPSKKIQQQKHQYAQNKGTDKTKVHADECSHDPKGYGQEFIVHTGTAGKPRGQTAQAAEYPAHQRSRWHGKRSLCLVVHYRFLDLPHSHEQNRSQTSSVSTYP
jgi:hypothetical protein